MHVLYGSRSPSAMLVGKCLPGRPKYILPLRELMLHFKGDHFKLLTHGLIRRDGDVLADFQRPVHILIFTCWAAEARWDEVGLH